MSIVRRILRRSLRTAAEFIVLLPRRPAAAVFAGRRRGLLAMTFLLVAAGCRSTPPAFHAVDITGADFGRNFELTDPDGRRRTLADFRGKYVLMFFGFTQCADICPTALSRAVEVRSKLGGDASRVQVIFVTVDPERDSPVILREYTTAFDASFLGLYGDLQATQAVAKEFRVFYQKVPTGASYTMDHTATTYVFDDQGRLRLAVSHGQSADEVAADLQNLMRGSG